MNLNDQLKSLSHHAYLLIGGDSIQSKLISILEKKHGISIRGNPDFFNRKYENFTIDDARELKSAAGMRPVTEDGKKIFVLTMNGITVEAQNALLKLLEEPAEYARFFLIVPSAHLLLPTVKSRLAVIDSNTGDSQKRGVRDVGSGRYNLEVITSAEEFLSSSRPKRLELIKSFLDEISKEKRSKHDAIDFLDAVESTVYSKGLKENIGSLRAIETARKYLNDRAPSMKMLLEYVALNI
jgi:hypothetical protein